MRKTDKKLDKQIISVLTEACETALHQFTGFQWLTHCVDYANFPSSLQVVCVFDTNLNLEQLLATDSRDQFNSLISRHLLGADIKIKPKQISYDSEEACEHLHNGNWSDRLAQ